MFFVFNGLWVSGTQLLDVFYKRHSNRISVDPAKEIEHRDLAQL